MKKSVVLYFFLIISFSCFSQTSTCNNADFELGNFTGWVGQLGYCCPIFTSPSGISPGRQTIMTGTGTDANACDMITVVAPGGTYSAKLGNDNVGSEAEKLSYSLLVTTNSELFIYKYAVILQDPGHDPADQPRFQVRVLNAAGGLISPTCGLYTVVASSSLPGWHTCLNDVVYKDWTTVGLNLQPYIGQVITIEFATGDCALGGHFGYAYVDAYYSPLQISNGFCSGSFSATLAAPIGFTYLWSTGETTQSINITNPVQGVTYNCTLTSVTGCTVQISTVLEPADMTADFELDNTCYTNATFADTSITPATSPVSTYLWTFGGGGTSTDPAPTHAFPSAGTYSVTLAATNSSGCTSTKTKSVTVIPPATAVITYASPFCKALTTDQIPTLTGTLIYQGGTFSSTAGLAINATTGGINPSASAAGTYIVSYAIPQSNLCTPIPATTSVTIVAVPTASINYFGTPYCSTLSSAQYVNRSGTGVFTGGVYTSTPAGLSIDASTGTIIASTSNDGTYTVTYTVPAAGCAAIPVTTTVQIIVVPTAVISYPGGPFCTSVTTLQVVSLGGTGAYTGGVFSSTSGLSLNSSTGAFVPSTSTPGTYLISYKIPQGTFCLPLLATVNVTIKPTPVVSCASQVICSKQASNLNISSTIPGTTFAWTYLQTDVVGAANGSGASISQVLNTTSTQPGTVVYTITSDFNGCAGATINTTVTVNPLPIPTLEDGAICVNQDTGLAYKTYTFDTLLSDSIYSFVWYYSPKSPLPIPGATGSTYIANQVGQYSVVATNIATQCASAAVTADVSQSFPGLAIISTESPLFTDDAAIVVQGGTGTYLYQLDGGIFQSSNIFSNLPSGVHTAVVIDTEGCTHISAEFTIIHYPLFFTPNNDGFHDYWNVFDLYFKADTKIYIYDRSGKLLKQISTTGLGWDGTFNGKMLPSEDYWFVVDYMEMGVSKKFKSHFALKR